MAKAQVLADPGKLPDRGVWCRSSSVLRGAVMLSSEARQVVMVVVAFAAGAALAWVPVSSTPLPFRATSTYPVWAFLIATLCGSCPLVWSHGRRALAQLPARRPFIQEALA